MNGGKNYHRLRIKKLIMRRILRFENPMLLLCRDMLIAMIAISFISICICWYQHTVDLIYKLAALLIVLLILLGSIVYIIGEEILDLERETKDFFE